MSRVRVYGTTIGNGSYARVTRGVVGALDKLGLLAGLVPLDEDDEWAEQDHGGVDAEVAVTIGPQIPPNANRPLMRGLHKRRLMLLPMNSSYCPEPFLKYAEVEQGEAVPRVTGWLTPSKWSSDQLRPLTAAPVTVWRHGVSSGFVVDPERRDACRRSFVDGRFAVLHLSSTTRQRKGTVPLIKAWASLIDRERLPPQSRLVLFVSTVTGDSGAIDFAMECLSPMARESIVMEKGHFDRSDAEMATLYSQFHAVAQPSRGEGFGMVPLEALCCGVPVVATACSGHSEFLDGSTPGVSVVKHGHDAKIDDGMYAVAPSVSVEAVADALLFAAMNWTMLSAGALTAARHMQEAWSWDAVMRQWAEKEGWL